MVLFTSATISEFAAKHPDSSDALHNFMLHVEQSDWSTFHELKESYRSVDAVGNDSYVFNNRGNKYRLVAMIHFNIRTFYLRFIGMHAACDRIKDISTVQLLKPSL